VIVVGVEVECVVVVGAGNVVYLQYPSVIKGREVYSTEPELVEEQVQ
jgi:hypothetical protein